MIWPLHLFDIEEADVIDTCRSIFEVPSYLGGNVTEKMQKDPRRTFIPGSRRSCRVRVAVGVAADVSTILLDDNKS